LPTRNWYAKRYSVEHLPFATGNVCIQIKTTLTRLCYTCRTGGSLPDWLGASIGYDRRKIILDEIKAGEGPGWKIGPIEITMVMYAASMDSPTMKGRNMT
jgi:hypothetical protein